LWIRRDPSNAHRVGPRLRNPSLFAGALLTLAGTSPAAPTPIDFEADANGNALSAGDIVDDAYLARSAARLEA
jgi:hypothetical protein